MKSTNLATSSINLLHLLNLSTLTNLATNFIKPQRKTIFWNLKSSSYLPLFFFIYNIKPKLKINLKTKFNPKTIYGFSFKSNETPKINFKSMSNFLSKTNLNPNHSFFLLLFTFFIHTKIYKTPNLSLSISHGNRIHPIPNHVSNLFPNAHVQSFEATSKKEKKKKSLQIIAIWNKIERTMQVYISIRALPTRVTINYNLVLK